MMVEKNLDQVISKYLDIIEIPSELKGYSYLKYAIALVCSDRSFCRKITKRLYPEIAKKFETNPNGVASCIRLAIEKGWDKTCRKEEDPIEVLQIFGDEFYRVLPKNITFISAIAEYIKLKDI